MQRKTLERILEVIQRYTLIRSIDDVQKKSRKGEIVLTRQLACYFLNNLTPLSQSKIGKLLGGIDHATVFHGKKVINNYIETNSDFRVKVKIMETDIREILSTKNLKRIRPNISRYKKLDVYRYHVSRL